MTNEKLKILATIPSGFCYGVQISTVEFFRRFPPNVESHFLITKWTDGELEKMLNKYNIPSSHSWLGMFSRKMDWYNLKMSLHALIKLPKLYYDYIKLLRKKKPDILFFANHHELILLYPVLLFTRRKIVCHMHDPSPAIPFQKATFKFYGSVVDKFMAITESVRQRTIALGCKPEKIQTISMGTRIPAEERKERQNYFCEKTGWPVDSFIVGITGQMTFTKGVMDVLEAFRLLYGKNNAARLVIGGKPGGPFYEELQQKIKEWGLEQLVYFPGWLPDVAFFFRNINAYVLASRHEEGFGMVVAEAIVAYVPVVVTKSGGVVELVEDEVGGYIVDKANPVQMSDRLYQLSVNPAARDAMVQAARTRLENKFDIEKQALAMVDFFYALKNS